MIFELAVVVLVGVLLLILYKVDAKVLRRFGLTFIAVLLFEYFTQALWLNKNLEPWAYLYLDVSWVLTVGWAGMIVVCMKPIEMYLPRLNERFRYVVSVLLIGGVGFFAEWVVVGLGIRDYPQAVRETLSGIMLGYGKVPVEALYYIPVFMALMVSFVHYWEIALDDRKKSGSEVSLSKRGRRR